MIKMFTTAKTIFLLLAAAAALGLPEISLASTIEFVGNDEVELTLSCGSYPRIELYRNGELVSSCDQGPIKYHDTVIEGNTYTYTEWYFSYDNNGQLVSSGGSTLGTVTAGEVWGTISASRTLIDTIWNVSKDLTVPAGVILTLDLDSALKLNPNSYGASVLLGGSLVVRNAQLSIGITASGANEFTSLNIADSIMENAVIQGAMTISITNSQMKGYFSIGNGIDSAPVARLQDFSMNSGPSAGWINAIASEGLNVKGNSFPGMSVKLNFASSSNAASSPVTIEDNVFGLDTLEGTVIGPYPALVKIQYNTIGELTVKHGLGQVLVEGNKGKRIAVFRDGSIEPAAPPPVFDDYQVIIRSNSLTNSNTIGSRCFSAIGIGADPTNANTAQAYPETGVYRVEANGIDTAGACPYSGQFNNGIALLGGASNNLIVNNSIKGGDAGIWLNGVSATTGNMITGNVLHDGVYGVKITGDAENNTVEKSAVYNMSYAGFYLAGNSSAGVFLEGNLFKENELENNWFNIRMDTGARGNRFYNNVFKKGPSAQIYATNNKVCTDANSTLVYCPNIWYEEKTGGTNIIGGPYIGGNYWGTSYNGVDADNDGLGDTPFSPSPENSKDLYPLVYELVVNRTGDQPDADLNDGRCDVDLATSGDQCTLRAAIEEANKRSGRQIIAFAISSTGTPVITPQSPLPELGDTMAIDASMQSGERVTINGTATAAGTSGLSVKSGDAMIDGLNITGFPGDGITASGAGYLAVKNADISNNGGYGAIAEGDIFVNVDPLSPHFKNTISSTPSRFNQNGTVGFGGGLTSKNARIWADLIEVAGNNGPGVTARQDIVLSAVQINNNKAVGIQSIFGSITFDRLRLSSDNNQVIGNKGPGILAGADLMLGSPGGMVMIQADIQVRDNAAWGIAAPAGIVTVNAIDAGTTARISTNTSFITGNGDKTKPCVFLFDDGTPQQAACDGGGILSGGYLNANILEVSGNNGPGIAAKRDILLSDARVNNNLAVGIQSIFGSITFDRASLSSDDNQVIGNQGPGILAGADLMLGSPGGMVTIQADIQVRDNAGWGIAAPHGGVAVNATDVGTPAPISAKTSFITGNGDKTKPCFYLHDNGALLKAACDGGGILSYGFARLNRTEVTGNRGIGLHIRKDLDFNTGKSCANTAGDLLVSGIKNLTGILTCDVDQDGISDEIENLAANNGDGNNDGIPDSEQESVSSFLTPTGAPITLSGASGSGVPGSARLLAVHGGSDYFGSRPARFYLPTGMIGFQIQNNTSSLGGILSYAPLSVDSFITTIFLPPGTRATTYWAYGPTADNDIPHWYEFLFDGATGAEILPDRIILHLIDGGRGDDDLTVNGIIVHNGGPGEFHFHELADALVVLKVLAGMEVQTSYTFTVMDVNGDGKIGLEEALYILQVVAGMRDLP